MIKIAIIVYKITNRCANENLHIEGFPIRIVLQGMELEEKEKNGGKRK